MKKTLSALVILTLIAGAMTAPATAKKKKKKNKVITRSVEIRYENPNFGLGGVGGLCVGCPSMPTGPGEIFVMIEIVDDVSPSGYVEFAYDADGDGINDLGSGPNVCGSTPEPVPIEPSQTYVGFPQAAGINCPGSSSISGTIKATFSNSLKGFE